jgi:hypothetical protein
MNATNNAFTRGKYDCAFMRAPETSSHTNTHTQTRTYTTTLTRCLEHVEQLCLGGIVADAVVITQRMECCLQLKLQMLHRPCKQAHTHTQNTDIRTEILMKSSLIRALKQRTHKT